MPRSSPINRVENGIFWGVGGWLREKREYARKEEERTNCFETVSNLPDDDGMGTEGRGAAVKQMAVPDGRRCRRKSQKGGSFEDIKGYHEREEKEKEKPKEGSREKRDRFPFLFLAKLQSVMQHLFFS